MIRIIKNFINKLIRESESYACTFRFINNRRPIVILLDNKDEARDYMYKSGNSEINSTINLLQNQELLILNT